jgi:rod shape-determining protein MreB
VRGQGIVLNEPSVVALDVSDGRPIAVGYEAKRMMGRTPSHIRAIRPLKDGVIADFEVCEKMLRYFIQKVHSSRWSKPRMVVCVPSGITGVETRAVQDAAEYAGARKPVHIIEEPIAAAIGADLAINEASGNMIVDIGGGTTEIAVIALGGIVCDKSVKIAGDVFTNDIIYYMRTQHNLFVGESTAEKIKIEIGAAIEELETPPDDYSVQGRDLLTGKPKQVIVSYREIAKALDKSIQRIEDAVMETLSQTPPELAADIYNTGIYLAGGGSMLRGLDKRISQKTDLPVYITEDPLRAVVRGTGMALKDIPRFRSILIK